MIGQSEHLLQPLTVDGKWSLLRDAAGVVTLLDPAAPIAGEKPTTAPTGAPIANLEFDANRNLLVRADSGAQFVDLNGPDPARLDSRLLTIAPGTKAFCRIVPVGSSTKTRFEVAYNTTQKGNRA